MSYILEALRKSQQDREIGRVPTLATQPLFTPRETGRNSWIGIALGLAALAVAIALYAVLRAGPETAPGGQAPMGVQVPAQNPTQTVASAQPSVGFQPLANAQPAVTAPPLAGANATAVGANTQATAHVTGPATGQTAAQHQTPPHPQASAGATAVAGQVPNPEGGAGWPAAQVPAAAPAGVSPTAPPGPMTGVSPSVAIAGPPGTPPTTARAEPSPVAPGSGAGPAGRAAPPAAARVPEEAEVDPEVPPYAPHTVGPAEPQPGYPPPAPPAPPVREATRPAPADAIPADLREDIEAFKDQIKGGHGGKSASKAKASAAQQQVPLRERRLPPEVQERLPSFLLTVHLYDADPEKRLVIIDGRRLRQGDATRSGILVEEIFPDGVALAFEGHRFFQPR